MRILVLGHGDHGKGTFCKMLQPYGFESMSSSQAALPFIFPTLNAALYGTIPSWQKPRIADYYETQAEAYADRRNHRRLWKELISLLNTPDKTTLTRIILNQVEIYDGMRCHLEFEASRDLFDMIVWVDRSQRVGPDPSMSIQYKPYMIKLDNNGTLCQLRDQVKMLNTLIKEARNGRV